jgi:hypothetical protein
VDVPEVEYARSGEVAIAYQAFGKGSVDLVFARGFAGDLLTTSSSVADTGVKRRRSSRARVLQVWINSSRWAYPSSR